MAYCRYCEIFLYMFRGIYFTFFLDHKGKGEKGESKAPYTDDDLHGENVHYERF